MRGTTTVVFCNVPAQICDNCGEEYVDEEVTARLLVIAANLGEFGHGE